MVLRTVHHPLGPRRYLAGRRIHHGFVGVILVLAGGSLMIHDRRDLTGWFLDLLTRYEP